MRDKILAELVKKFPGLSKQFLGQIATQLAKKVTEESGIDQAITDYDNAVSISDLAAEFQKEGDRRVTEAKKAFEAKKPKAGAAADQDEPEDPKEPKAGDIPAWAKSLLDEVKSLRAEKTQATLKEKIDSALKDKVPARFYKGRALPEPDKLQEFVDEVVADYTEFQKETLGDALDKVPKPGAGGVPLEKATAKRVEEDIKNWAQSKKPAAAAK